MAYAGALPHGANVNAPIFVFIHGGAWPAVKGSGKEVGLVVAPDFNHFEMAESLRQILRLMQEAPMQPCRRETERALKP